MKIAHAAKCGLLAVMIAGTAAAQAGATAGQAVDDPAATQPSGSQNSAPAPNTNGWHRIGDAGPGPGEPQGPGFGAPLPAPPAQLTIAPGTFLTIRLNQMVSSNRNHVGDAFSGTLVKPVVVNGVVVADRGQTILGTVSEVKKGGLLHGSSSLGLQVTDLTLVDGQQMPVATSLVSRNGPGTGGRNAAVIGGTTAVGAGIGAVADGGVGAAAGAGAGLAAGTLGALLTPGYPSVVYPEQILMFRVQNPVVVSTARAPQAFRPVSPEDYQQAGDEPRLQRRPPVRPYYYGPGYAYGPGPYYGYYGYPYYYGPTIGIGVYGRIRR